MLVSFVHQNDVIDVVETLYIDLIKNIDYYIKVKINKGIHIDIFKIAKDFKNNDIFNIIFKRSLTNFSKY